MTDQLTIDPKKERIPEGRWFDFQDDLFSFGKTDEEIGQKYGISAAAVRFQRWKQKKKDLGQWRGHRR